MNQSPKLVAVWTSLEPTPSELSLTPTLIITPIIFNFFFAVLYDSIPGSNKLKKGVSFKVILWGTHHYRYASGQKRCNVCEIFLNWDGFFCPCCGMRLRTRPKISKYRQTYILQIKQLRDF